MQRNKYDTDNGKNITIMHTYNTNVTIKLTKRIKTNN